jgi:hypothetical protein
LIVVTISELAVELLTPQPHFLALAPTRCRSPPSAADTFSRM